MNLLLRFCFQCLTPFPATAAFPATGHDRQEQENRASFALTMTLEYLSTHQSRLEISASGFCFLCHHVPISHRHAVQHAGLSATIDLGSPATSFQCLKSYKGRKAVELCYVERTLLSYSRSCDRGRISKCGLMQYPPSPAGRPDPIQGQTHHMAQSADMNACIIYDV